eukprot:gene10376-12132_t
MQQWVYVKSELAQEGGGKRRFLKADSFYDIHGVFTVAKSARNYDIGTSALTVKTIDASGDLVAKSVRALIIPYQHPMSLLLESMAFFPARVLGAVHVAETVDVWVNLMSGYHEPGYTLPPTDAIELYLNAPVMDLQYAYITVMPKLRGVVYYMYYYPWTSFFIGCAVTSGLQVFLYGFIGMAILTLRYFFQTINTSDPLAQQYAHRRRAAFPSATATSQFTTRLNTTVDRTTTDDAFGPARAESWQSALLRDPQFSNVHVPSEQGSTTGNRHRTTSGHSTSGTAVSGNMRLFVATHRPSTAAPEVNGEVEDELIDTINANLLSSRDRNRVRSLSNENPPNFTHSNPNTHNNNNAAGGSNNTVLNARQTIATHTVSGLRAAPNDSPATPDSHDWDTNFRTPHTTSFQVQRGASNLSGADSIRSRGSSNSSSTSAAHSGVGTPSGTISFDSARGVRGGVGGAHFSDNSPDANYGTPRHTSAGTGTGTPSSTTSSNSYAYSEFSENDSEVPDETELNRVFENDFFNRYFPFLGRKGSMFGEDEHSRGSKKKR